MSYSSLDDDTLAELNNGSYDQIQIFVKNDRFILRNLEPKNPNAQIFVYGGKDILVQNCDLAYLSANASESAAVQESVIPLVTFSDAINIEFRNGKEFTTFTSPKAQRLDLNYSNVQIGSAIPNLKKLHGRRVENFSNTISTMEAFSQNIKKVGNLYIAPQFMDEWDEGLCVYNTSTQSFVHQQYAIPMSRNETSLEKIENVKETLMEVADIFTERRQKNRE